MNSEQVQLVQSSFAKVAPIADTAADLFYTRLFELDSDIQPMFKGDMKEQGRKLMQTLGLVVNSLDNLERVLPAVKNLARRHVDYGVKPEHYDTVGAALLWTLEKGLGPDFTPEVKGAWTEAYVILAGVMKETAYPH